MWHTCYAILYGVQGQFEAGAGKREQHMRAASIQTCKGTLTKGFQSGSLGDCCLGAMRQLPDVRDKVCAWRQRIALVGSKNFECLPLGSRRRGKL